MYLSFFVITEVSHVVQVRAEGPKAPGASALSGRVEQNLRNLSYLYYGNYNFSYYSFFLRGYKGLKVVTICYYKYLYINIYDYIFIYTFLYLHFKSVRLGQNKTVITEIVICNRFFSGIEMHTFIAPKTMTISSQSYEL